MYMKEMNILMIKETKGYVNAKKNKRESCDFTVGILSHLFSVYVSRILHCFLYCLFFCISVAGTDRSFEYMLFYFSLTYKISHRMCCK